MSALIGYCDLTTITRDFDLSAYTSQECSSRAWGQTGIPFTGIALGISHDFGLSVGGAQGLLSFETWGHRLRLSQALPSQVISSGGTLPGQSLGANMSSTIITLVSLAIMASHVIHASPVTYYRFPIHVNTVNIANNVIQSRVSQRDVFGESKTLSGGADSVVSSLDLPLPEGEFRSRCFLRCVGRS